jgi:hypothetical protein
MPYPFAPRTPGQDRFPQPTTRAASLGQTVRKKIAFYALAFAVGAIGSPAAYAVDGCKLLLCLAGSWSSISQCRPDVEQAFRDVARGRGWPTCGTGGSSSTQMQWATEATCPRFYSYYNADNGGWSGCQYDGVISVRVNNAPWSDVFWSLTSGPTSTRYHDPARAALGAGIDPKYDQDAAAYVPPSIPTTDPGGGY